MFGERELAQVNPAYFNIIVVTDMDVTVQSKNSGGLSSKVCKFFFTSCFVA